MRLSVDPHRAAIQICARQTRHSWMKLARNYSRGLGGSFASKTAVADCIRYARHASRAAWQIGANGTRSPN